MEFTTERRGAAERKLSDSRQRRTVGRLPRNQFLVVVSENWLDNSEDRSEDRFERDGGPIILSLGTLPAT